MISTADTKKDFPIFNFRPDLVYLDSAATSLKPQSVINKEAEYYKKYCSNIHRGIYEIAEIASKEYDETRTKTAAFIKAKDPREIIFTRNTTESLNLVASTLGADILTGSDEIVTTIMEHHSNFVTWQQLSRKTGAKLIIIDINEDYELEILERTGSKMYINNLDRFVNKKTKILAITLVSNTLGTINPVKEIIKSARQINPNIIVVVDGAQAVPHIPVNVVDMDCDFFAFSAHKMLGPTGVGVLWGKYELLSKMSPYQYGGDMILKVTTEETTFNEVPYKFEAGTPNIAGVIALKKAISYLSYYNLQEIHSHELELAEYTARELKNEFGDLIKIYSSHEHRNRSGVVTFSFPKIHPHDIAQILSEKGVAVRAGHHCTMPLHIKLGVPATTRASFYLYNDQTDANRLVEALISAAKIFKIR